jgi:hypothetical protein
VAAVVVGVDPQLGVGAVGRFLQLHLGCTGEALEQVDLLAGGVICDAVAVELGGEALEDVAAARAGDRVQACAAFTAPTR